MSARLSAFVIWSLVAAAIVFWVLRFGASGPKVPANAVAVERTVPLRGDLSRLFGAAPVVARAAAPQAEAQSRFRLLGVMAPKSKLVEGTGAYGVAVIAVDGKPARAFAVGAKLEDDIVLQSVGLRTASLGPANAEPMVMLELPALPPPATGVLPPNGAPPAFVPSPPAAVPVPAMSQPGGLPVPARPAPAALPAMVPPLGGQAAGFVPPNSNLPVANSFRAQ